MKITKFGHCALLIEVQGVRLLTDPGGWIRSYVKLENLDAVLITHEHPDHLHVDSLKEVLKKNPRALILTNNGVGNLLQGVEIKYKLLTHGESCSLSSINIEGFGEKHAEVHSSVIPVDNTGFFINEEFFYPGDAYTLPQKDVRILALPVAGPWVRLNEAIAYAQKVNPKIAFPVHDAAVREELTDTHHKLTEKVLKSDKINFFLPELGKEYEV